MPEVAQIYLGNIHQNQELADRLAEAKTNQKLLEVNLEQSDRAKGRISCTSTSGMAIGIIKSREFTIKTGDVYQTQNNLLLLVQLIEEKFLVLSLPAANNTTASKLVRLGHLLGNQHYPIKIENHQIYIQLRSNHHQLGDSENILIQMIREIDIADLNIAIETGGQPLINLQQPNPHNH